MVRFFISLLLTFAGMLHCLAQIGNISFDHITPRDGLTHMVVFDMLEDQQGFIWFASQLGLDRYDGHEIRHFQSLPDEPNSLSNNIVTCLLEDPDGIIWIGTNGGLNCLDPRTMRFTQFRPKNVASIDIWRMALDSVGNLWICTLGQGLFRFHPGNQRFDHFVHNPYDPNSLSHNIVRSIAVDTAGTVWVGTLGGLDRIVVVDKQKPDTSGYHQAIRFQHFRYDRLDPYSISHNAIESLYIDRDGGLWVGTSGGGLNRLVGWRPASGADSISKMSKTKQRPLFRRYQHDPQNPHSLSSNFVTAILQDRQGNLWVGTASRGINILARDTHRFYRYEKNAADPHSLGDNFINAIMEDRAGNVWIATQEGGVSRYSPYNQKFNHMLTRWELPPGLESNNLNAVIEDENGDLWVSFIGYGLAKYDRKHRKVIDVGALFYKNSSALRVPIPAMCRDAEGVFWLGTWGDGIRRFDPRTQEIIFYRHNPDNPNSLSDNRIIAVFPRSDGTIWITTQSGGLNRFDPRTETFIRFLHNPADSTSISNNLTHSICEDQNGTLWIGTLGGGLNKLIEIPIPTSLEAQHERGAKVWKFQRFQNNPHDTTSLAHNMILSLLADSRGNLWVGTAGAGLDKLNIEKGTFQHFSEANGYPFRFVTHIQEDAQGNLWVVTTRALVKFNPDGLDTTGRQFLLFDFSDELGVNLLPTVPSATWRSPSGEIFLAGYNGIVAFHPEEIHLNPYVPPVRITKFTVLGKPVLLDSSISVKKKVILPYNQNTITLEFAALNYVQSHKNQYIYRLKGFDEHWIMAGNQNWVTYTNLDPGTYLFQVKGSNNDGVWNTEGASLWIHITPPWWRTPLAYVFYALAVLGLLYSIRRFELNRIHLRNELKRRAFEARKLQEIDEIKSRFFANISHEFRTPLTLIMGPLELLENQMTDREAQTAIRLIRQNARRLQRLIQQLLDLARFHSGQMALRTRRTNIVAFVHTIVMTFTPLAERKRIQLNFTASVDGLFAYVDEDKLEKIISNLLSNALKFTQESGKVTVSVCSVDEQHVEIAVSDNGPGIAPEHQQRIFDRFYQVDDSPTRREEGLGLGLALARELTELHGGTIHLISEVGKGATFRVRLPLGTAHLKAYEIVEEERSEENAPSAEIPNRSEVDNSNMISSPPSESAPYLLIVEDNPDVRLYMRQRLQSHYRIAEAENGQQGWDQAVAEMPDLIICDVMMPGMDGFTLCHKLKQDPRTSHIPIILLTARASWESKIKGLKTGADDYIIKPFDMKELEMRIQNLIVQRQRLRRRFQVEFLMEARQTTVVSADERFIQRAMDIVETHMADPEFSVEQFSREIALSTMQLHRKLKSLTGYSAGQFIRMVRLKRAAYLLKNHFGNVAEIAYEVGFNNPSYFAARFREVFGVLPSEYLKKH